MQVAMNAAMSSHYLAVHKAIHACYVPLARACFLGLIACSTLSCGNRAAFTTTATGNAVLTLYHTYLHMTLAAAQNAAGI